MTPNPDPGPDPVPGVMTRAGSGGTVEEGTHFPIYTHIIVLHLIAQRSFANNNIIVNFFCEAAFSTQSVVSNAAYSKYSLHSPISLFSLFAKLRSFPLLLFAPFALRRLKFQENPSSSPPLAPV